jgi:FkbM family methyltransferase
MKNFVLRFFKSNFLQSFWEKLFHISKIGMNYWGTEVHASGELKTIEKIQQKIGKSSAIVFDVGANKGQFISHVSKIFSSSTQFFCFEPSKTTFNLLATNVERFSISNVRIFNFGLSNVPSKQTLYMEAMGSTKASLYQEEKQLSSEEIELSTIDIFCDKEKIERIDFLKIDVEGHELAVLKGAKKMLEANKIRFIQFEFGDCNINSRTFFKDFYLMLEGYTLFRILPDGLRRIGQYTPELEVFSTCNYLAVVNGQDL